MTYNSPAKKLPEAARQLRATWSEEQADLISKRITEEPEFKDTLAELLDAVYHDWHSVLEIRSSLAGRDDACSRVERAALSVARTVLGEPQPVKPKVPIEKELFAGLPEDHRGDPQDV